MEIIPIYLKRMMALAQICLCCNFIQEVFTLADEYDVQSLCTLSAEKYFSRLQDDYDIAEFLHSVLDVCSLTPPQT